MKEKTKFIYPAIFTPHNDDKGYSIFFPDLEVNTFGNSLSDALEMAEDGLCVVLSHLEENELPFPDASNPNVLQLKKDEFVNLIMVDVAQYRKKYDQTLVRKTLNIPRWLNLKAEKEGVNFSQVLTDALLQRFNMNPEK